MSSSSAPNPFKNQQDEEIIDKYISNDQQQSAVKSAPPPVEDIPDDVKFLCYSCKKPFEKITHDAQRYLTIQFRSKFLSYCSQRCFNTDIIPCTVQQTMDHQLLAQTIKQESKMWDLSVHVIIGLINKCIVEGTATYGDDMTITGIYQCAEKVYEWLNAFNIHHHCLFVEVEWKGGKKRFYMLQGKGEDPEKVQQAAESLSESVPKGSLNILQTVFTNILEKPQIEKVRRLPMDAPLVQQNIVQVETVLNTMKDLGFTQQNIDGREYLVWSLSGNQENLRQLQPKLKTLVSGGKILKRSDRVPDPHDQFTSQQVSNLGVGSVGARGSAPQRAPSSTEKPSSMKDNIETTTTTEETAPRDSAAALRDKAKQIRQQKEDDERKQEYEREKRRRSDAKKAKEAMEEREEKQRQIQRELEREKKRREKQEDREARRRLKEQLKKDKEERLARKHSGES